MRKPKKKRKNKTSKTSLSSNGRKEALGVKYICQECKAEEIIPYEVLEEFDAMYPEQLLYGPHQFRCSKCKKGIMEPKEYEAHVIGYGLYEGIDYKIKRKKK